jgi:hypothetical protein
MLRPGRPAVHLEPGCRAVFLGRIGPRGRHCDVLSARQIFATVRFDDDPAGPMLCLTADLHRIPRRPRPDF